MRSTRVGQDVKVGDLVRLVSYEGTTNDKFIDSIARITEINDMGNPVVSIVDGFNVGVGGTIVGYTYEIISQDWDQ
jgi:hypothetical protein